MSDVSEVSVEELRAQEAAAHRQQQIDKLRALADWLEANPGAAPPDLYTIYDYKGDRDKLVAAARALGGRWTKKAGDYYFEMEREVIPGLVYRLYSGREQVCERIVTGTETVEVPDPEALKQVPKITQEREIVEWRCPDALLNMTREEGQA